MMNYELGINTTVPVERNESGMDTVGSALAADPLFAADSQLSLRSSAFGFE